MVALWAENCHALNFFDTLKRTLAQSAKVDYQTDNLNSISNVLGAGIKLQMGWGQKLGDGNTSMTDSVTFPEEFTTILGVLVTPLGAKGGSSTISSITDMPSNFVSSNGLAISSSAISTTGFTVDFARVSGSFATSTRYGFSWIAWGI